MTTLINTLNPEGRYATQYSTPWAGQDGRQWRRRKVWCFPGWREFLEVQVGGEWQGW